MRNLRFAGRITVLSTSLAVLLVLVVSSLAAAVFLAGIGTQGSFSSGTLILQGTSAGTPTCVSSPPGTITSNAATCTSAPVQSGTVGSGSANSSSVTLNEIGSSGPTAANFQVNSCGLASVADLSGSNKGIVYGTVTFQATGPWAGSYGITFNNTSQSHISTLQSYASPGTLTEVVWFKAPVSGYGGNMIGFTDVFNGTPTKWDRQVWMDPTGHIVYGVYPTGVKEVRSGATYNDGNWHMVAASYGPTGMELWVDGRMVARNSGVHAAQASTGYWHLGYSNSTHGWKDPPSSNYWNGQLSQVAIIPSQLSKTQILSIYTAGSSSAVDATYAGLSPTAVWPLNDTGLTLYTGTLPGRSGSVYQDLSGNGNTASPHGSVTQNTTGPLSAGSISLNGSAGTYLSTNIAYTSPGPLSEIIWFKAPVSGYGGNMIGFTSKSTDAPPTEWDRQIWMDPTGHIVYGIYPGSTQEVTSPLAYNDNAWHFLVASYGPAGQELWVDGSMVASNPAVTTAQMFAGYWHLGYSNSTTGWPDPPSSDYWNGQLAQVAIIPAQLTGAQVGSLYAAGSSPTYSSQVLGLTATSYWPLTQMVSADACSSVLASVQTVTGATTACAYPSLSGPCPALAPGSNSLGNIGTRSTAVPAAHSSQTVTLNLQLPGVTTELSGAHLLVTVGYLDAAGGWAASLAYQREFKLT